VDALAGIFSYWINAVSPYVSRLGGALGCFRLLWQRDFPPSIFSFNLPKEKV
jgi:hypothetical protein